MPQQPVRGAFPQPQQAKKDVLSPEVLVVHLARFSIRQLQSVLRIGVETDLAAGFFRCANLHLALEVGSKSVYVHAQAIQSLVRRPLAGAQEPEQEMLSAYELGAGA
jgi:hypothetical protein